LRFIRIKECMSYIAAWVIAAAVLLPTAAAVMELCDISAAYIGYFGSAISFLAAMAAGTRTKGKLIKLAASGVMMSALLTAAGWCIAGDLSRMKSIVSVIPFTITGTVAGGVIWPGKNKNVNSVDIKINRHKPKIKPRQIA